MVKFSRWLALFGLVYAEVALWLSTFLDPTPENKTLAVSITLSGVYTLGLYLSRRIWLPWFSQDRPFWAGFTGIFNAAFIEALFLVVEKLFGATGVAAHPNLFMDWIVTMPWYVGIVVLFVWVQRKQQYPPGFVLLLGALYESGGDGLIGGILVPLVAGPPPDIPSFCVFMPLLAFWQFISVYSSMVLIPALILADEQPVRRNWLAGFWPLAWIAPYSIYVIVVLLILFAGSSI